MASQSVKQDGKKLTFQVEVFLIPEGEQFVAYCPALELSSYGNSIKEARQAFSQAMDIFVRDTQAKGTLEKILLGLGWSLKQVPVAKYEPPRVSLGFLNSLGAGDKGKIKTVNESMALAY